MVTKEQERKALEQIRKIVAGLGEDSYIGTAFEGCFEIAEENIENDFACSLKQRLEVSETENRGLKKSCDEFKRERDEVAEENERLRALNFANNNTFDVLEENDRRKDEALQDARAEIEAQKERAEKAEAEIIQLKAKLYDFMIKEA